MPIRDELSDHNKKWWDDIQNKILAFFLGSKLKKIFFIVLSIIIGLVIIISAVISRASETKSGLENLGIIPEDRVDKIKSSEPSHFSNWENYNTFEPDKENSVFLCPTYSKNFPEGRVMYSPNLYGASFVKSFSVQPLSEKRLNAVFELKNIFRCIIGNGNYKNIDCEPFNDTLQPYLTKYLKETKQNQAHAWINRYDGIKPKTKILLTVKSSPKENSEILNVSIELKFIPNASDSGQYETEYFQYNIPTKQLAINVQAKIGIGLIDPIRNPDNVCAIFENIE